MSVLLTILLVNVAAVDRGSSVASDVSATVQKACALLI